MSVDVSAAPQFPRVYRVTRGWQVFTFAMCGLLGIPALAGIGYFAITQDVSSLGLRLLMMTFCGGFVILTSYTTFDMLASRLYSAPIRSSFRTCSCPPQPAARR